VTDVVCAGGDGLLSLCWVPANSPTKMEANKSKNKQTPSRILLRRVNGCSVISASLL
jgi:hypothetical protein